MIVFIDGENLRHRLVQVLHQEHRITDYDDQFAADIGWLAQRMLGKQPDQIRYYTTRIKQPAFEVPELLERKITTIQESHRRWIARLTNQGITVVKVGNLKVHESSACYHCGRRTMVLQEKGVDVRLAAELVMAAVHDGEREIVLFSSDADMIPALQIASRSGANITYCCFSEDINKAVVKATDKLVTYDRQDIHAVCKVLPHRPFEQRPIEHKKFEPREYHG